MQKLSAVGIRLGAIGVAAALCTGCPNPQVYGTPRTTPVGKVQHTVAAEGFNFGIKYPAVKAADGSTIRPERTDSATLPNLPTYQLRVGVLDTLDVGVRIANLSSVGADVKWNFIKGDVFDMGVPDASGTCPTGSGPVYRLYNNGQGGAPNHRYTDSVTTRAQMLDRGWIPEGFGPLGVVMCAPN